jgi:regulator of replication initiation timing
MPVLPITRIVLYKHGVGYFERQGPVEGEATLALTFKQAEVSDVLKSLTVLDLDGGHIASVSYDSTKPLQQLLAEVALTIPDQGSLVGLLPQIKGARIAVQPARTGAMGVHAGIQTSGDTVEGILLGVDTAERQTADGISKTVLVSLLTDGGAVRSFDLHGLAKLEILDSALRRDLDYYLRTQLSAKKTEARTFTFFAQGQGRRTIRLSYTLEAPVWKATYRILLGEEGKPPLIQGWAVVDNTQNEDWENVQLALVAGLPVSFVHDLYTPRYIRRPVVAVQETTGVLPPEVEEGIAVDALMQEFAPEEPPRGGALAAAAPAPARALSVSMRRSAASSTPTQVRERKLGDLFEYTIEHPVTIRRNQSALVPIVLRPFEGRPVLLYNKQTRAENPMRCVEFKNTTGLTLEGGPVTVLEGGSYVGEAMLETLKPQEQRLVAYAVELAVHVLDNIDSHEERAHRVVIRQGQMRAYYTQMQQTTYTWNNKSDHEQTIYLDHPRPGKEWQLADTPGPQETTENYWRFRFALPAQKVTTFVVRQQRVLHQSSSLSDLRDQQLAFWLDQRYLDQPTAQVLKQVAEHRQQVAGLEQQIQQLEQERGRIHLEQQRIRENLQALGDRAAEKELRERFVRALNTQEDRLEQMEREFREQTTARDRCREQINQLLAGLEYEAPVS